MARTRSVRARLGRGVLGLLLGLVACELLLQGVTLANRALASRAGAGGAASGGTTWIAVGDSNTYGVFEDAEAAYPARLEQLLHGRAGRPDVRVVNLGMPGSNARQAGEVVGRALDERAPELALVLAGVNNAWSWHPDHGVVYVEPPWYERLRLVRLGRLLRAALARQAAEDEPQLARTDSTTGAAVFAGRDRTGRSVRYAAERLDEERDGAELEASVAADLVALAGRFEGGSCRLVLLTYAAEEGWYGPANHGIRAAAERTGVLLVDCARMLEPVRARYPREALLHPDGHPRAVGYELYARAVLAGLAAAGLVEAEPFGELDEGLAVRGTREPAPRLDLGAGDRLPVVEIEGQEPGRRFVVLLSGTEEGAPVVLDGIELPVLDDELHRATRLAPELRGTTDGAGRARVPLAPLADEAGLNWLRGQRFRVAFVVLQGEHGLHVRRASEAAESEVR